MNRFMTLAAAMLVLTGSYLAGGYVEYSAGFPFGVVFDRGPVSPPRTPPPSRNSAVPPGPVSSFPSAIVPQSSATRPEVQVVSRAQGAQDAPRADVPMGETIDLQRCYDTMIARKLIPVEAKTVCAKLIGGISH